MKKHQHLLIFLVFVAALCWMGSACASLFGGTQPPVISTPPPPVEETPAGRVVAALASLRAELNSVVEDGVVDAADAARMSTALTDFSFSMVDSVRVIEAGLRAEIRQAQEQGGGVDWPSTLLQVGISALLGGATGFQIVRKAPNRTFLGTEPDADVARAAGIAAPEIAAPKG